MDLFVELLPMIHRTSAQLCHLRRIGEIDAEEFRARVEDKLMEDDFRILRDFRGESSIETYLRIVIRRLLNDYCDHLWGRWRPSRFAQRGGDDVVEFDRLLNADGLSFDEAYRKIAERGVDRDTAWEWHERVKRDGRLRQVPMPEVEREHPAPKPDEAATRTERRSQLLRAIQAFLLVFKDYPAEDRLLLQLFDLHGLPMKKIAEMLGIDAKLLYRRRDAFLKKIRGELERHGLTADDDLTEFLDYLADLPDAEGNS